MIQNNIKSNCSWSQSLSSCPSTDGARQTGRDHPCQTGDYAPDNHDGLADHNHVNHDGLAVHDHDYHDHDDHNDDDGHDGCDGCEDDDDDDNE